MIFHKEGTNQVSVSEPHVAEKQVNKRRKLSILNGFINKPQEEGVINIEK